MATQPSQKDGRDPRAIQPTGPDGMFNDAALTIGLFGAYINNLCSVRNAVWTRYTAFLIGNSVFVAFVGGVAEVTSPERAIGAFFGVILCVIWFWMLLCDRSLFDLLLSEASSFSWPALRDKKINPVSVLITGTGRRLGVSIYWLAFCVIWLFRFKERN
jgi:uncharacterized membrane protein YfcA